MTTTYIHPDTLFDHIETTSALDELELVVPPGWGQGRTVFGGLSAALLYAFMKQHMTPDRVLRSVTFNFVGPLKAGEPFSFDLQVLREGKSATQLTASIQQEGNTCVAALACFAVDRESGISVPPKPQPLPEHPGPNFERSHLPPGAPEFAAHVDLHISEGDAPYSGSDKSAYRGWMRLTESPRTFSDAHIILLIDCWPPTVVQMFKGPAPQSTMSWNLEFMHPFKVIPNEQWLAYEADTVMAGGGYAHTEARVLSEAGELVAVSRQVVTVFDR